MTPGIEVGGDARLERLQPWLLEPWQSVPSERFPGQIRKRATPPDFERGPQRPRRVLGSPLLEEPPPFVPEALETGKVELLRVAHEHVSGRARLEHFVRLQQLPQSRDVLLERGRSVFGRVAAPELLDQAVARDDTARVEQKQGEQAPLLDSAEANGPLAVAHLERTEDGEVKAAGQGATVPRVSAA